MSRRCGDWWLYDTRPETSPRRFGCLHGSCERHYLRCGQRRHGWVKQPWRRLFISALVGDEVLLLRAEAVDAESHDLAALQEARRLEAETNAGRSAGGDDITRIEPHELADIVHEIGGTEDHRLGRPDLDALAIDL